MQDSVSAIVHLMNRPGFWQKHLKTLIMTRATFLQLSPSLPDINALSLRNRPIPFMIVEPALEGPIAYGAAVDFAALHL